MLSASEHKLVALWTDFTHSKAYVLFLLIALHMLAVIPSVIG